MAKFIDLKDKIFGRWLVLEYKGQQRWLCKCTCMLNTIKTVNGQSLRDGKSTSCGCVRLENLKKALGIHNLHNHPVYKNWLNMKNRCYNKNNKDYNNYGGRGIIVCNRWINSFINFWKDFGHTYINKQYSIDRIDTNGNYEPSNVKWSTVKEQAVNKNKVHKIYINSCIYSASDIAKILNMPKETLCLWIRKYGIDNAVEKAFSKYEDAINEKVVSYTNFTVVN